MDELRETLGEAWGDARKRERALFAELTAQPDLPVVLFGAGNLGRPTLALLRARGRTVAAFTDNNRDLWGSFIDGVRVLSSTDASSRFARDGLAVVTIWRAEGGHDFFVTSDGLRRLGWRRVESFIPLFWGCGGDALPYITVDLPTKVIEARDLVMAAAALWSGDRSLREYVAQIHWRLTGDFGALTPAEPDEYFADGVVHVGSDEVFVDCGAFSGDTLLDVAQRVGSWRLYHAFEPDAASFAALERTVATLPSDLVASVRLHRAATADTRGEAAFSASGTMSAGLCATGASTVECVPLDEALADDAPTFIKMDVEGAEAATLSGALTTIRRDRPSLAIAAYHRQADLWRLPLQIAASFPDFRLFLRPHAAEVEALGGVWASKRDLVDQIMDYIKSYNEEATPFSWNYTGKPLTV